MGVLNAGAQFAAATEFVVVECCNCRMLFAMTVEFNRDRLQRRRNDNTFYCPRGHAQHYTGESEAARLKRELAERTQQRDWARQSRERAEEEARHANARARGYKGHAAKLTKRIKAGECPSCHERFHDLERHMAAEHPDFGCGTGGGRQLTRERFGQSALPRFNPYSIPPAVDPKAVDCPYCVKRPRNLQAHCRAVHPDRPEARQ